MSDLHFEFHQDGGEEFIKQLDPTGVDILVLAGDICPVVSHGKKHDKAFEAFSEKYKNIVYVLGNHEYYGAIFESVRQRLQRTKRKNVHVLQNESLLVDGVQFYGGTMWFSEPTDPMVELSKRYLRDFTSIKDAEPNIYKENVDFTNKYPLLVKESSVVVTHHLPSSRSTPSRFKHSSLNPFFVFNMEERIAQAPIPQLWIHGHTHDPIDYKLEVGDPNDLCYNCGESRTWDGCSTNGCGEYRGYVRVVAMPLGYPGEQSNLSFNDKLIISVNESWNVP